MQEIPQEPYETEQRPKQVKTTQRPFKPKPARRSQPRGSNQPYNRNPLLDPQPGRGMKWGFWEVLCVTVGIPYAIFLVLAFIGSFLK